jgi:peptide/nickel transport system substrate-binding protein
VAQAVAGYLQAVGFAPSLSPSEANTYYTDVIPNGHTGDLFEQVWGGWTFDFDNTAYLLYHSGQFWNPYIKDQKLDGMLEAQRAIMDRDKRQAILRDAAKYISDNYLELPLYNQNTVYGINKRVKGLEPAPDDRMRFQNATVSDQ